jgi:hypothetical protein
MLRLRIKNWTNLVALEFVPPFLVKEQHYKYIRNRVGHQDTLATYYDGVHKIKVQEGRRFGICSAAINPTCSFDSYSSFLDVELRF